MGMDSIDLSVQAYENAHAYIVDARTPEEGLLVLPYEAAAEVFPTKRYGSITFVAGKMNIVTNDYSCSFDVSDKISSGLYQLKVPSNLPSSLTDKIRGLPINMIVPVRHVIK